MIGRAGEIVRPVVLPMRDKRVRPAASFVTIMIERLYDTITVVSIFALNLLWLKPATGSAEDLNRTRAAGLVLVILLAAGIAVLIWFKRRSKSVIDWLDSKIGERGRTAARVKRALLSTLEQLATALSVLSNVRQLAISLHLVDFAPAAIFGLFYFLRGEINVSQLRSLISADAVEHAVEDEKVALAQGG